jgi:hypothetical protein
MTAGDEPAADAGRVEPRLGLALQRRRLGSPAPQPKRRARYRTTHVPCALISRCVPRGIASPFKRNRPVARLVMAALVAAIHVFASPRPWMRGTSPRMT